jgi:flagellar biogenesis protein FliO
MLARQGSSNGLGCVIALLAISCAQAQTTQLPSGAVRSHYARVQPLSVDPVSPPASPETGYAPADYPQSPIAPISYEQSIATETPTSNQTTPIPLTPRGTPSNKALVRTPTSGWGALSSVGASLGLVLAAFLCVAWLSKRYLPQAVGPLPKEAVEQLGWAPLSGRQQMQLVRLGNKLLLIAVTPGSGAEPLGEVTDPTEVERLSAMCRRQKPESSTRAFREVMSELERQPVRGFVDSTPRTSRPASTASNVPPQRPTPGRPLHG